MKVCWLPACEKYRKWNPWSSEISTASEFNVLKIRSKMEEDETFQFAYRQCVHASGVLVMFLKERLWTGADTKKSRCVIYQGSSRSLAN